MEESKYSESIHGAKLLAEMKAVYFERSFPVGKKLQIKFLKEEIVAMRRIGLFGVPLVVLIVMMLTNTAYADVSSHYLNPLMKGAD